MALPAGGSTFGFGGGSSLWPGSIVSVSVSQPTNAEPKQRAPRTTAKDRRDRMCPLLSPSLEGAVPSSASGLGREAACLLCNRARAAAWLSKGQFDGRAKLDALDRKKMIR